jgi:hypothetical protein
MVRFSHAYHIVTYANFISVILVSSAALLVRAQVP